METFSALLAICEGNSPVPGEFPTQRPVTRSFDVFFDLRLNKRMSKQSWGWWFETLPSPFWRQNNGYPATERRSRRATLLVRHFVAGAQRDARVLHCKNPVHSPGTPIRLNGYPGCYWWLYTLRQRQNGRCFEDTIFKCISFNENCCISMHITTKIVAKCKYNQL